MHRHRKRKNPFQLEFAALVEAAEHASLELLAQRRARRRLEREQRKAVRLLEAPWRSRNGFDEDWLNTSRERIEKCDSLREGIVLAASRVSELLDKEIEDEGEDPEWKLKYDAFCAYKKEQHAASEDEDERVFFVFWEMVRELFETYYALNSMDDWRLFEHACSGQEGDLNAADIPGKQRTLLEYYSGVVYLMHTLLVNNFFEEQEGEQEGQNQSES